MGMQQHVLEAQTWPLKLRCCATLSAFCEECNGDSEDARRPLNNFWTKHQQPSKPYTPVVYTCRAH
eukprot:756628-Heterocapsa_arctica.AAC.1